MKSLEQKLKIVRPVTFNYFSVRNLGKVTINKGRNGTGLGHPCRYVHNRLGKNQLHERGGV